MLLGGGSAAPALNDLQGAYDAWDGADPAIELSAANGGITVRDAAIPLGVVLWAIQDNAGAVSYLSVAENTVTVSGTGAALFTVLNGANRIMRAGSAGFEVGLAARRFILSTQPDATGRFGFEMWPDNYSITTATGTGTMFFSVAGRIITLNIPAGGGLGNDTAPGFCSMSHTARFEDLGFLFASQLLVNAAVVIEAAANVGPIYLFLDQYLHRADGGVRTVSQHNAMRAQPRWGPNVNGGSLTQTSAELYFANASVDATVGSCAVTTLNYFAAKNPTLTAGGTIGTLTVLDIVNLTSATTIRGINSAMSTGTFIRHTGIATSELAGTLFMNNGVATNYGSSGSAGVQLLRSAAGVLRMIGVGGTFNEGLDWDFDPITANTIAVTSSTGAGLGLDLVALAFGSTPADPSSNWFAIFAPPSLRTPGLAGDYHDILFTAAGNLDLNGLAMGNLSAWNINSLSLTLSGGTATDIATLRLSGMTTSTLGGALTSTLHITGREVLNGSLNLGPISPAALAGDVNDYTGMGTGNSQRSVVRVTSDDLGARTITGFDIGATVASRVNDTIWITNVGTVDNIILAHQNAGSAAANRIISPTGADYTLNPDESAFLWYDDTTARWRILWGTGA